MSKRPFAGVSKMPDPVVRRNFGVFLGGTIDMADAHDWRRLAQHFLVGAGAWVYNPRPDTWDPVSVMSSQDPIFSGQVAWDLAALSACQVALFYFAPGSVSPISLFELGTCVGRTHVVVCCPDGYTRQAYVEVACQTFSVPCFKDLDAALRSCLDYLGLEAPTPAPTPTEAP